MQQDQIAASSLEEVAERLLEKLQPESPERLLALDVADSERWYEKFQRTAVDSTADLPADEQALLKESPWVLPEVTFERQGRLAAAAAFSALMHDRCLRNPDEREPLFRAILRFKIAFDLYRLNRRDRETLRRCAELAWRTAGAFKDLELAPRLEALRRRVLYKLYHFSGRWLHTLGDPERAEDAFGRALCEADSVDQQVLNLILESQVQAEQADRGGDPRKLQWAYRTIKVAAESLDDVNDPWLRKLWELTYGGLATEAGVSPDALESVETPGFRAMWDTLYRLLEEKEASSTTTVLEANRELVAELLHKEPRSREDYFDRHRILRAKAVWHLGESDFKNCEQALSEAEALEDHFTDVASRLSRLELWAMMSLHLGRVEEVIKSLESALPEAMEHLPAEDRIGFLGEYLKALGLSVKAPDAGAIRPCTERLLADFEALLRARPSLAARRVIRDRHHRSLEAAVMAHLSMAQRLGLETSRGQKAVGRAWGIVAFLHNPELHWAPGEELSGSAARIQIAELEDAFHQAFREALLDGDKSEPWRTPLDKLLDYELRTLAIPKMPGGSEPHPTDTGVHVMLFRMRDLFPEPDLVVMTHHESRFALRVHSNVNRYLEPSLEQWVKAWAEARGEVRGVVHDVGESCFQLLDIPLTRELLPEEIQELTTREPCLTRDVFRPVLDSRYPRNSEPWFVLTDDLYSAVPVEMLPDDAERRYAFGQNRAVTLCLRPAVPAGVRRPVDFSRGWLGLGDVPEAGGISGLPGTLQEIEHLRWLLEDAGHPCGVLLGSEEARADRLAAELEARRPAVLHLAVHGLADETHPEACTLILADCPERPERELLPYRRIRELPLEGVELVVLSACSGLIGRSGRSASMEGLAWAFLGRGVTQVIASRYPVDDEATVEVMLALYRGMLELPVADALGRARDVCLVEKGLGPREVGAWSVWC